MRRLYIVLVSVIFIIIFLLFYLDNYYVYIINNILALSIACLGLNIITGYSGQMTLAHNAFVALGAYIAAILQLSMGINVYVAIVLAALISGLGGLLISIPAQRIRGLYLALVTLALAIAVTPIIKSFNDFTGGVLGLTIPKLTPPGWWLLGLDKYTLLICGIVFSIIFWISGNLMQGVLKRGLVAMRDGELAALALGIRTSRVRAFAFAYGCALAGLGGALLNLISGFIAPESFSLMMSIEFLAACALGGIATVSGALVAGVFMEVVPPLASAMSLSLAGAIFGGILVIVVLIAPKGVAGYSGNIRRYFIKENQIKYK